MKKVENAWLFDVDGVISDPFKRQIIYPEVIDLIGKRLELAQPVSLTTGRTVDWLKERILKFFTSKYKNYLDNLFISAEKGGVWASFNSSGKLQVTIDESLKVPQSVRREIEEITNKFKGILMFDKPKKTMVSLEMKEGIKQQDFKKIQPKLDKTIASVLKKYNLQKKFKIDSVIISTDVESVSAGKGLGAKRFLDWLNKSAIQPNQFYAFGDAPSDVEMAKQIHKSHHKVTYVFTGEKQKFKGSYPFEVIFPKQLYTKGAIEFLTSHT